jgi:hypothetical protein
MGPPCRRDWAAVPPRRAIPLICRASTARDDWHHFNFYFVIAGHEHHADMPVPAWQRWLLSDGESLVQKHVVRGDEAADGLCEVKNGVTRGAMNAAMVGSA